MGKGSYKGVTLDVSTTDGRNEREQGQGPCLAHTGLVAT
jgi:hypothetical protein